MAERVELGCATDRRGVAGATFRVDRLLDVRGPDLGSESTRHQFYRRHRRLASAGAAAILAVDGLLIGFELNPAVFHFGLAVLAGVILYFWVLHATAVPFPKQVAGGGCSPWGLFWWHSRALEGMGSG